MKKIIIVLLAAILLTGCVAWGPWYDRHHPRTDDHPVLRTPDDDWHPDRRHEEHDDIPYDRHEERRQ